MEMKCARCHDAPNHPFNQEDLFKLAAMLQRKPLKVPADLITQGLGADQPGGRFAESGTSRRAHCPFTALPGEPLPGVLRKADDTREQLAAILTDPRNGRFAQVMVNRLWKELLGFGIVEPVDDWENTAPSHPDLLAWLGHELAYARFRSQARSAADPELADLSAGAAGRELPKRLERRASIRRTGAPPADGGAARGFALCDLPGKISTANR